MNVEVWQRIFKKYIADFEAIETLGERLIDDEKECELKIKLLDEIIDTFRSEVEE